MSKSPFDLPDPTEVLADLFDGSIYDGPKAAADEITSPQTPKAKLPTVTKDADSADDDAESFESKPVTYRGLFKALREAERGTKPPAPAKEKGSTAGEQKQDDDA